MRRILLAFGVTLVVLPVLLGSTGIALRLWTAGYSVPAAPLLDKYWAPWLAVKWLSEWGWDGGLARLYWQGLALTLVPVGVIWAALGFRFYQEDFGLRSRVPEEDRYLGTAGDLARAAGVAATGSGVVLGRHGQDILRDRGTGHVLVAGPSGSGKSVGVVIPTLLDHPGSILVHDPKHALSRICGRHRASLGPTWVFNPTVRDCDHFNPLLAVRRGDEMHGDCETIGTLIATSGEASDPVWEEAAGEVLTALLLVSFEHRKPTLAYVHDMMFEVCAQRYPATANPFSVAVFGAHKADHHKITSSVNFTMRARMKFMSDPVVREVTSTSDFLAGDLFCSRQPTTIFVTVPPADRQRMQALMRVTMQMLMNTGLYRTTHVADGREKTRDLLLLFDEFPTLKRMEFLSTNIAECREYGIRCVLVAQDLDQIQATYGDNQSITANCTTAVIMPGFSQSALETISDWGGTAVKMQRSRGREMFRPLSVRSSESEHRVATLNAQDMIVRASDEVLVFRSGSRPTYLEKVRYFAEPRWRGMTDA